MDIAGFPRQKLMRYGIGEYIKRGWIKKTRFDHKLIIIWGYMRIHFDAEYKWINHIIYSYYLPRFWSFLGEFTGRSGELKCNCLKCNPQVFQNFCIIDECKD